MNDFQEILAQLRAGKLSQLVVERKDFMKFREVWMKQEDRICFVGEAGLNGQIIYRYQK